MNQYVKQYKQSEILTASREQILIMLYEGAIQFLIKAKTALNDKNIEELHNNLVRAQNIIQEFINTLDRDVSPQLADNLTSLYEYFIRRLVHANVKKELAPIEEVLGYMKSLKATWEKAIELAQQEEKENAKNSSIDYYSDDDDENDEEDDDEEADEDDEEEDEEE